MDRTGADMNLMDDRRESLDAVRARLADRGLLRRTPDPEPAGEAEPAESPYEGRHFAKPRLPSLFSQPAPEQPAPAAREDWDVESQGGNAVEQSCPRCSRSRLWPADVTRFRCDHCDRAWRWAACDSCRAIGLAQERLESWQCRGCGAYTRSWWRTASAQRDARGIVARLRQVALERERAAAAVAARRRRRRLRIVLVVVTVTGGLVLAGLRLAQPTKAAGTAVACEHFDRLRGGLANGTLTGGALAGELVTLADEAGSAEAPVRAAVAEVAAAGDPAGAPFLVASTRLTDACAAAG
ncbi:MAG TPA: hypothetical protein VFO65_11540 [Acidimicrobiales bacterium]|nr:hypothetical protein [Acidimicrobiales bacterium]